MSFPDLAVLQTQEIIIFKGKRFLVNLSCSRSSTFLCEGRRCLVPYVMHTPWKKQAGPHLNRRPFLRKTILASEICRQKWQNGTLTSVWTLRECNSESPELGRGLVHVRSIRSLYSGLSSSWALVSQKCIEAGWRHSFEVYPHLALGVQTESLVRSYHVSHPQHRRISCGTSSFIPFHQLSTFNQFITAWGYLFSHWLLFVMNAGLKMAPWQLCKASSMPPLARGGLFLLWEFKILKEV